MRTLITLNPQLRESNPDPSCGGRAPPQLLPPQIPLGHKSYYFSSHRYSLQLLFDEDEVNLVLFEATGFLIYTILR